MISLNLEKDHLYIRYPQKCVNYVLHHHKLTLIVMGLVNLVNDSH